ncbi:MAG: hypothetical protein QXU18_06945 [Thermoplasmatales archaeon]
MKLKRVYLIGIIINIALCILPVYDTANVMGWITLSLSFHNSLPVFFGNLSPESIFTLIVLIPMNLVYRLTLSTYSTAVLLKLILFLFFLFTVLILNKIFEFFKVGEENINFLIVIILLNPGILFINYFWAELEIIPAFFVSLAYYIIRVKPFRSDNFNIILSTLSLFISIFFFIYPIIFLPSIILYTRALREKMKVFISSLIFGISFLLLQIYTIQGYLYDYAASFTGAKAALAPSGLPTGLFYYFNLGSNKGVIEIALVLCVSIVLPLILYVLKYEERKVMYVISALFIFTAITINMDNFLFIVPFVFLASVEYNGIKFSRSRVLWTSALLYIPLIFAPLVYSHQDVYGIFYWLYPMIHLTVHIPPASDFVNIIIPSYNWFFLLFLYLTITIVLLHGKKMTRNNEAFPEVITKKVQLSKSHKKFAALAIVVLLVAVPMAFIYNESNNNVSLQNTGHFPLMYFYPEFGPNNSMAFPIGNDSYSISNSSLIVPHQTPELLLYRNISNENFAMNASFYFSDVNESIGQFLWTDQWSVGERTLFNSDMLDTYAPVASTSALSAMENIQPLTKGTDIYYFNGTTKSEYTINSTLLESQDFLLFVKPLILKPQQSDVIELYFNNITMEVAMYPSYAVGAEYTKSVGWVQTFAVRYNSPYAGGWDSVEFIGQEGKIALGFNGVYFYAPFSKTAGNVTVVLGAPYIPNGYVGYATSLFYYSKNVIPTLSELALSSSAGTVDISQMNRTLNISIYLQNNPEKSELVIDSKHFQLQSSNELYFGKTGDINKVIIKINSLHIKYSGVNNYYLVPAFLVFYFPFVLVFFVLCLLYDIPSKIKIFFKGSYK